MKIPTRNPLRTVFRIILKIKEANEPTGWSKFFEFPQDWSCGWVYLASICLSALCSICVAPVEMTAGLLGCKHRPHSCMLGPYGTFDESDSFWQFVWPAGESWWCSSCPASHTGAARGLAAGLLLSCGPTTFLVYWPASLYLPYSLDAARERHKPSGPPTGAALSNLWATDRLTCYEPGINQTARGGRNDLWPPPEKHSLRRLSG